MKKPLYWLIGLGALAIVALGLMSFQDSSSSSASNDVLANHKVTVFKTPTCNCCKGYVAYLKEATSSQVKAVNQMDLSPLKDKLGIPQQMESCHTVVIDDYVVEGHVPLKAVDKLLREQPDIKGIALPNMPQGSPGMTGEKSGPFQIYAIQHDGSYAPYVSM